MANADTAGVFSPQRTSVRAVGQNTALEEYRASAVLAPPEGTAEADPAPL
ncbi:MAG: hypothetical protein HFI70_00440 [Lachnospiraceae bacterium]|nr:hypothetical protein [Lachnospiraceae bacterium]